MQSTRNPPGILGLFAKHPDHVAVKTRLARRLGTDLAHQAARLMTQFLLDRLAESSLGREIVCWPPQSAARFRTEAGAAWTVIPQSNGDLGDRMSRWFQSAIERDYRFAIAIGSDCPLVHPGHLDRAATLLGEGNDLVLGPAVDGGYWLVGLSRKPDAIFANIEWGSEHVLEATLRNASQAGWRTAWLETLRDVDEMEDLVFAIDQLVLRGDRDSIRLANQLSQLVQVENK